MALPSLATLAVAPIPGLSDEVNQIRLDTASIVSEHIIPNEEILTGQTTEEERQSLVFELQTHIKAQNLWAPHLPKVTVASRRLWRPLWTAHRRHTSTVVKFLRKY